MQITPVTPRPPSLNQQLVAAGKAGSGGSGSALGSGDPWGPARVVRGAVGTLPVPQHDPAVPCPAALGRSSSLPRHPAWTSQELRGGFPEVYLHGGCGGSGRRRFIFTVGVCGATWAQFLSHPSGHRPGDGLASGERVPGPTSPGVPAPGKRPRKETFPSLVVLPLAERVMKILGKCYTTRGYPFGAKFPEKPGRFPGGEGRCWGRRYLPGSISASSAIPPRFPSSRATET